MQNGSMFLCIPTLTDCPAILMVHDCLAKFESTSEQGANREMTGVVRGTVFGVRRDPGRKPPPFQLTKAADVPAEPHRWRARRAGLWPVETRGRFEVFLQSVGQGLATA